MRKLILVALAAAAVSVPVAFAAPGTPGKPNNPAPSVTKPAKPVAFILKGVVTSVAGNDITITVNVKAGNVHAKRAFKNYVGDFVVKTDAKTKISKAGAGTITVDKIATNDRVVVHYSAKKSAAAAELSALFAKKVTDQGPKPAA